MTFSAQHRSGGAVHRGPSGFWPESRVMATMAGEGGGIYLWDDFTSFYGLLTSTTGDYSSQSGGWVSYQDSSDTVSQLVSETGGVVRLATDGTDNDEVWLSTGAGIVKVDDSLTSGQLFFETRVRTTTIASRNIYFGLSEEGLAAADTISDAGALADKDLIGFSSLEGDATGLDFIHNIASGGGVITVDDDALTLAASTWYKVGFHIDLSKTGAKGAKAGIQYIDGEDVGVYLTRTQIEAATFPAGEELGILFGIKNGTTTITVLDVDWVRLLYLPS